MCGRFVAATPPDLLAQYFGVERIDETLAEIGDSRPRYNVAPTQDVPVVLERDGVRSLEALHWGLVPFWAKDPKIGNRMINARSETIATKNSFRAAFKKRRCIIPADGFYEWKAIPGAKKKQPMYIERRDGSPFAFAGLYEIWRPPETEDPDPLVSCTIITGEPNSLIAEIHHRMPIMLPPTAWDAWLDPENHDTDSITELLVPAPSRLLRVHPVSTAVNNARANGPELTAEIDPDEPQDGQAKLL